MLEYQELRIRISREGESYRTYAEGPTGNASGHFMPPYSGAELNEFLLEISDQLARARKRKAESPELDRVRHFGEVLFDALIDDDIRDLYYGSLRAAEDLGKGLRITLSLKDAPDLLLVPWEYLYDDPDFLATSDFTPIVRYLDLKRTREPIEVARPLRILGMVSSPSGVTELDVEREMENIDSALAELKADRAVDVTWIENATLDELHRCLRGGPYHVFHFIGHGEYDQDREESVLLFEDERGRPDPVGGEHLGATLAIHPTLRLAVLNSCEGGRTADDDPFAGVATGLVERQIPAVIAMQFAITDRIAAVFSTWLYESLAAGFPVDRALSQARLAIFRRPGVEWGTPVLFMRVRDGRIFDVPEATAVPPPPPPPPDPEPDDEPDDEPDREPSQRDDVLPWWRQRIAAIIAAVLVALLAVAAGAYALRDRSHPPPPPQSDLWSAETPIKGMNKVQGIAPAGRDSAYIVGANGGALAAQRYANGTAMREAVDSGSGTMRSLAVSGGIVVAGGRAVDESQSSGSAENDAGIWLRGPEGVWTLICKEPCGDDTQHAVDGGQVVLDITANAGRTFVAVGREIPRGGVRHPAVWRSDGGTSWQRIGGDDLSISDAYMTGVAAMDNTFVAVGNIGRDGAVWISTDGGREWRNVPDDALAAQDLRVEPQAVTASSSSFVVVGKEHRSEGWVPVAWLSPTGLSWTRASVQEASPGQEMADVATRGAQLMAVGIDRNTDRAAVWESKTGALWSPVSSSSFSGQGFTAMLSLTFLDDGTVLAGGADDTGGRIWLRRPSPTQGASG